MEWTVPAALVVLALLLLLLSTSAGRRAEAARQTRRLEAVERKLNLIMARLEIHEPEPDVPGAILEELLKGHKIQAIKEYRAATGAGLKEAKDAVELIARQRGLE